MSFPLWVVKRVLDEAEARFQDEKEILCQIDQLHELRGEMGEEEFTEGEAALLSRLKEARARKEERERG